MAAFADLRYSKKCKFSELKLQFCQAWKSETGGMWIKTALVNIWVL